MSSTNDADYYRHRVEQERRRAVAAQEGATRRIHLDLATRYEQRAVEVERGAMFNPRGSGSA